MLLFYLIFISKAILMPPKEIIDKILSFMLKEILFKDTNYCIDSIVEMKDFLVIGSYDHHGTRSGCIQFLDKNTKGILKSFDTSGTLALESKNELIYAANADSIQIYCSNGLKSEVKTDSINTCIICINDIICVTDINGNIKIFDSELKIKTINKISESPAWVVREINKDLFIGCENGLAYKFCIKSQNKIQIGDKRTGIIDFLEYKDKLFISSYDDNIEIFNKFTLEHLKTIENTGSCWKMILKNDKIFCAMIYDGIKIFDLDFELIHHEKIDTICYGLCLMKNNELIWASFYGKKLYFSKIAD